MREITLKKITNRLVCLKVFYYVIDFQNLCGKYKPSRMEMKYIRLILLELQEMAFTYDWYCLCRDWANDERNGRSLHTPKEWRKAVRRLQGKWHLKTLRSEHLELLRNKANR